MERCGAAGMIAGLIARKIKKTESKDMYLDTVFFHVPDDFYSQVPPSLPACLSALAKSWPGFSVSPCSPPHSPHGEHKPPSLPAAGVSAEGELRANPKAWQHRA